MPTKIVPLSPRAIMRAPGMPCAQISTLKPGGTLSLSTWIFSTGVTVIGEACGASLESAMLDGWPCFQAGGGCCACSSMAQVAANEARQADGG